MNKWKWQIENSEYLKKSVERCVNKNIVLPTFNQLKQPETIPLEIQKELEKIEIDAIHPLNLFRINWRNNPITKKIDGINFLEIPKEITGVKARIIGLVGKNFPTGADRKSVV